MFEVKKNKANILLKTFSSEEKKNFLCFNLFIGFLFGWNGITVKSLRFGKIDMTTLEWGMLESRTTIGISAIHLSGANQDVFTVS